MSCTTHQNRTPSSNSHSSG